MGDMEQYEARMCARDAVIDQYDYWLELFTGRDEPRLTLISWKRFTIQCWRCEYDEMVVKVGALSYELDCGHIADRELVDKALIDDDASYVAELYAQSEYDRYHMDCPVHLVKVRIDDVHGDTFPWQSDANYVTYELSCGCLINEERQRMECYHCPLIDGVAVPMPRVKRLGRVIEAYRDATQTYELECGHVAF